MSMVAVCDITADIPEKAMEMGTGVKNMTLWQTFLFMLFAHEASARLH